MSLQRNIPLKKYSNYKIGGIASYFCEFKSLQELIDGLKEFKDIEPEGNIFVLGGGTNILFKDSGFEGLVLKNSIKFMEREGEILKAGAGTLVSDVVTYCSQDKLSGLEWAGGLPGTIGGGIRGNAGAFMGEMGDGVLEVESLNIKTFEIKKRNKNECKFGYRLSIFKEGEGENEIILSVTYKVEKGNQDQIKKITQKNIDYRIDRHPLNLPNIGSTFKNVPLEEVPEKTQKEFADSVKKDPFPVLPVAKLLIAAGFMGKSIGGAQFSMKHPNFIVNTGNAKATEVLNLINLAKKEIKDKYNVSIEEEIMVL